MKSPRGRPALRTYLLARQGELFPDAAHMAALESRYPYLASFRVCVDAAIAARSTGRAAVGDRAENALKKEVFPLVSASFFCQAGEVAPPEGSTGGTFGLFEKVAEKS